MSLNGKITLVSSDGENFEVDRGVVMLMGTIAKEIEDTGEVRWPLPTVTAPVATPVTAPVLRRIVQFCEKYVHSGVKPVPPSPSSVGPSDELAEMWADYCTSVFEPIWGIPSSYTRVWDTEFVNVDKYMLILLTEAVNHLDIKGLVDMTKEKLHEDSVCGH